MTEAGRKLVVDRHGVTIVGDRFHFSASATPGGWAEPELDGLVARAVGAGEMESVITGLQSMTNLTYGQYCGVSRALELIGERWSILLVRDLLVGSKTVAELRSGFPRIPEDTLAARLKELEHGDVVRRDGETYELTAFGRELDDIVLRLGRWGSRLLGDFRPEDIVTEDAMVTALRGAFRPAAARGRTVGFQLQLDDLGTVVHGEVRDGALSAGVGPVPDGPDLVIEPGTHLVDLMAGTLDPEAAMREGLVRVHGDPDLLRTFVEIFPLPDPPVRD